MNFINNSNVEVIVQGWFVNKTDSFVTNKFKKVKAGQKIFVDKSITGSWTISDQTFERIGELYDAPTSYKKIYYMITDKAYKCEYNINDENKFLTFILNN